MMNLMFDYVFKMNVTNIKDFKRSFFQVLVNCEFININRRYFTSLSNNVIFLERFNVNKYFLWLNSPYLFGTNAKKFLEQSFFMNNFVLFFLLG
jgi:hypothetical protein